MCESRSLYPLLVTVPPKISQRHSTTPLRSATLFPSGLPQMISSGSPESGRITSLPSLANTSGLRVVRYSVQTFHRSQVSLTTDKIPLGYIFVIKRRNVSTSVSLPPEHITLCSVAGTDPPTNSLVISAP